MGEANDVIAQRPQFEITSAVILEGNSSAVVPVAVCLNDQSLTSPNEVHEQRADPDIHLGGWQSVPSAEIEKEKLQLASGLVVDSIWL